jgi:large subunit ribosomal protein L19
VQVFQRRLFKRRNVGNSGETFTVRKVSNGIGVERIFPILSPMSRKIEITSLEGKVRRSRLFYLHWSSGKAAKIKELKHVNK